MTILPKGRAPARNGLPRALRWRLIGVLLGFCLACGDAGPADLSAPPLELPRPVRGELRLSLFGPGVGSSCAEPAVHESTFVRAPGHPTVEDNDIRGFLDGETENPWNQVGQVHVRAGRKAAYAPLGEHELFRTLLRWEPLPLPSGARILAARLVLAVEVGPLRPLDLWLYQVHRDWEPGEGGASDDDTSRAVRGELWWRDARRGIEAWGLPGAGFAAEDHPEADTPVEALAAARFAPGDDAVIFTGERLAKHVQGRVAAGEPLRWLVKVSDDLEDRPDSRIKFFAADAGDAFRRGVRPRLEVRWSACGLRPGLARRVVLEPGRSLVLPRVAVAGATRVAATFEPDADGEMPWLEVRGGRARQDGSTWQPLDRPHPVDAWEWAEVRVTAARNPVALGQERTLVVVDGGLVWADEERSVHLVATDPTGETHRVAAERLGPYRWSARVPTSVPGRWSFLWTHSLEPEPFVEHPGVYDVLARDPAVVEQALLHLLEDLRGDADRSESRRERLEARFLRLQRAALRLQTPASFRAREAEDLLATVARVRRALRPAGASAGGESPPD